MPTSPPVIIDMRCLQDPNYAERGIGNGDKVIVYDANGLSSAGRASDDRRGRLPSWWPPRVAGWSA